MAATSTPYTLTVTPKSSIPLAAHTAAASPVYSTHCAALSFISASLAPCARECWTGLVRRGTQFSGWGRRRGCFAIRSVVVIVAVLRMGPYENNGVRGAGEIVEMGILSGAEW